MNEVTEVRTRDRERTCWEMLQWFESPKYVGGQLGTRHGPALAAVEERATDVAAYVVQAREYFEAARHASLATQPTMLYYGMACFSSAISLVSDPRRELEGNHGMSVDRKLQWKDLPDLEIKVKKAGVLRDLLDTSGWDRYAVRWSHRTASVKARRPVSFRADGQLRLGTILLALPDLGKLADSRYPGWPDKPLELAGVDFQEPGTGAAYKVILRPKAPLGKEAEQLAIQGWQPLENGQFASPVCEDPDQLPLDSLLRDFTGAWYLYEDEPFLLLPQIAAFLAFGFCLGFLARYRPKRWAELVSGRSSNAVHIIRRFSYLVFEEFPVLALGELLDSAVSLGPSFHQMG